MHVAKAFEKIIKLNKKIAELNYKLAYMEKMGQTNQEISNELDEHKKQREELFDVLKKFNIEFFVPYEEEIKNFNNRLKDFSVEQINLALKKKQGSAWELLKARAAIIKNNLFHAELIGKLAETLLMVSESTRNKIIEAVKNGKVFEDIEVTEEEAGLKIAKYLYRLGIDAKYENGFIIGEEFPFKEIGIKIGEKTIYVPESKVEEIAENERKLKAISIKIQVKNAEKQIKNFSNEEDKEFEKLQEEYLKLLKKREEYLEKYKD